MTTTTVVIVPATEGQPSWVESGWDDCYIYQPHWLRQDKPLETDVACTNATKRYTAHMTIKFTEWKNNEKYQHHKYILKTRETDVYIKIYQNVNDNELTFQKSQTSVRKNTKYILMNHRMIITKAPPTNIIHNKSYTNHLEHGMTWEYNNMREWVSEQCFTCPPTQYRLYGRRFLQVKRPNQQYQSTEGRSTKDKEKNENN